LVGFFKGLQAELTLAKSNLTITIHTIGSIDTPSARDATKKMGLEQFESRWRSSQDAAKEMLKASGSRVRFHDFPPEDIFFMELLDTFSSRGTDLVWSMIHKV
jgi:hypothetical protein